MITKLTIEYDRDGIRRLGRQPGGGPCRRSSSGAADVPRRGGRHGSPLKLVWRGAPTAASMRGSGRELCARGGRPAAPQRRAREDVPSSARAGPSSFDARIDAAPGLLLSGARRRTRSVFERTRAFCRPAASTRALAAARTRSAEHTTSRPSRSPNRAFALPQPRRPSRVADRRRDARVLDRAESFCAT